MEQLADELGSLELEGNFAQKAQVILKRCQAHPEYLEEKFDEKYLRQLITEEGITNKNAQAYSIQYLFSDKKN